MVLGGQLVGCRVLSLFGPSHMEMSNKLGAIGQGLRVTMELSRERGSLQNGVIFLCGVQTVSPTKTL